MADGFGSGKTGGVGKFGRANPGTGDTRMQAEGAAGSGQDENHHHRPDNNEGNRHGNVRLLRAAGAADGNRAGNAANRAAGAEGRGKAAVKAKQAGGGEINAGKGNDGNNQRLPDGSGASAQNDGKRQRRAHQHDAGLHIIFGAQRLAEPGRQTQGITQHEADEQRHQRRFQLCAFHCGVGADDQHGDGEQIERDKTAQKAARVITEAARAEGERAGEQQKEAERAGQFCRQLGDKIGGRFPAGRGKGEIRQHAALVHEKQDGSGDDQPEADDNRPAVFLLEPDWRWRAACGFCRLVFCVQPVEGEGVTHGNLLW